MLLYIAGLTCMDQRPNTWHRDVRNTPIMGFRPYLAPKVNTASSEAVRAVLRP